MTIDLNTDWRITTQMDYLKGVHLKQSKWVRPREEWDHDHCEFCWETIWEPTGMAYCTTDYYHWICEECYNDFKDAFEWVLE